MLETMTMATPLIEAEMKLHPHAQSLEDEWSGITNPVLRRKLQNRLNQRAARRRKAARAHSDKSTSPPDGSSEQTLQLVDTRQDLMQLIMERARTSQRWLQHIIPEESASSSTRTFESISAARQCRPPAVMTELLVDRLNEVRARYDRIKAGRDLYPLPADHLLTLVYYNVYRALIKNVAILGLNLDLMATDDYPSPFTPLSPTSSSVLQTLPAALQPTALQRSIAHHPQWDIVPDPVIRDNLLRKGEPNIDDVELCMDLIGSEARRHRYENSNEPAGCIVWGDPWAADSWEVTESFVRKYPWLFAGAQHMEKSTNAWRSKRDETEIRFEELGVEF